jgi:hypothetical protein
LSIFNEAATVSKVAYTEAYMDFIEPFNKVFTIGCGDDMDDGETDQVPVPRSKTPLFLPEDNDTVESEDEPDEYDETTALPQLLPASEAGLRWECAYNYSSFHTTYCNRLLHSFPRLYHP